MNLRSFGHKMDATTRDEILKHAQYVFAEVGFKEATVRQISKKAKTNVCLISYYFGGKEGLYKAVFERMMAERVNAIQKHLGDNLNIETKEQFKSTLQDFLEAMFLNQLSDITAFHLINREMMEGLPRVEEVVQQFIGKSRDTFVQFIEMGQRKKFVKKSLDPFLAAMSAIGLIMSFVSHLSLSEKSEFFFPNHSKKELPDKMIKTITAIYIDGVIQHETTK